MRNCDTFSSLVRKERRNSFAILLNCLHVGSDLTVGWQEEKDWLQDKSFYKSRMTEFISNSSSHWW